jgi:hypothetical protein
MGLIPQNVFCSMSCVFALMRFSPARNFPTSEVVPLAPSSDNFIYSLNTPRTGCEWQRISNFNVSIAHVFLSSSYIFHQLYFVV